ncbi:hypothetical protein GO013_15140 [Pseudodesulfovibrio sp. JC047]|uniref:hypothetical protein n=1 Tax=Pseudodesulfovibrio sp. JC047 TaxID=2683199 RepID=UPI0013D72607|nr:hypothetical protein [Pseudodesulfovibrio sp. JC047]NDV20743.1 hypothetical protein [Pseudodesulfovibrio sp. JC047]
MISYTQIYKVLVLIVLAMKSNQIRGYLEVDPVMAPLGYSAMQAGAYSVFFGVYITTFFLTLRDVGKFAILALSVCLLIFLYYPAVLFLSAIVAGLASDIPVSLTAFLVFSILALGLGFIQMKKVSTWLTLSHLDKRDCPVAFFLMLSLPTIWISSLFGEHTIAFLNYYTTFLYVVFAVMLVSIWQSKALNLLLHLVFFWSILCMSLIVWFGYWQTGYLLTCVFHGVCAIVSLYVMCKKRQVPLP